MGRKALGLGEHGEVTVTPVRKLSTGKYEALPNPRARSSHYRAVVWFRSSDGKRRQVQRIAGTRAQAEADALEAVRERLEDAGTDARLTKGTPIVAACALYLDENSGVGGRWSDSTETVYRHAYARAIASPTSSIAGLTLEQVNDGQRLNAFLSKVATVHGTGTAKHVKAILSGTLRLAVSYRILATNEMRQVEGVRKVPPKRGENRDRTRALTLEEREHLLSTAEDWCTEEGLWPRMAARRVMAADLTAFLLGTGARISEGLGMRWEHLDLTTGRCEIWGTKTASSVRVVTLPPWLLDMVLRRSEAGREGFIFHAPTASAESRWDKHNAGKAVRELLDAAGLDWAVPHTMRRTVATRLHAGGTPVNRVADQLGHKDASMTARTYLGRDLLGDKADLAKLL